MLNGESEEMNREKMRERTKYDLHADTNHSLTHTHTINVPCAWIYSSQCTICVFDGKIEHAPLLYFWYLPY